MTTSILTCRCGAKNRLALGGPNAKKFRCGSCKHEFEPLELAKAVVDRPAVAPAGDYNLGQQADIEWECPDQSCGWSGYANEAGEDVNSGLVCPECGKKAKVMA